MGSWGHVENIMKWLREQSVKHLAWKKQIYDKEKGGWTFIDLSWLSRMVSLLPMKFNNRWFRHIHYCSFVILRSHEQVTTLEGELSFSTWTFTTILKGESYSKFTNDLNCSNHSILNMSHIFYIDRWEPLHLFGLKWRGTTFYSLFMWNCSCKRFFMDVK